MTDSDAPATEAGCAQSSGLPVDDAANIHAPLMALMLASQQGYALFDETDTLRFANPVFRHALGLDANAFPSWEVLMRDGYVRHVGTQVDTDDFDTWLRSARSRRGKLPFRTIETRLTDGRWVLTTETTMPGGWMLCVMTDVSDLGGEWRSLRQERDVALKSALSDELTGLSNRRYLMTRLNSLLGPGRRAELAVVILDLDHFKTVNDRYGHDTGDRVLQHFSLLLQSVAGRDDLAGRLGGEEFLLIFSGSDPKEVDEAMRQLFLALSTGIVFPDVADFRYTCSAGVAHALPGDTARTLLRRADLAMYEAKRRGRNRYVVAPDAGDAHAWHVSPA